MKLEFRPRASCAPYYLPSPDSHGDRSNGGCPRESARVQDRLAGLLRAPIGLDNGTGRYDLHELIRQFAAERLAAHSDDLSTAQERHAHYYLRHFAEADDRLRSPAQPETLVALSVELENFRDAWDWAVAAGAFALLEPTLRTVTLLFDTRGWQQDGWELVAHATSALEAAGGCGELERDDQVALGHLLAALGVFTFRLGQPTEAGALLERSLALLRPLDAPRVLAEAITFLALVEEQLGDYARSAALFDEGLALATAADDPWFAALCRMGRFDQAGHVEGTLAPEDSYAEAQAVVAAWRATGDPRFTAVALNMLAWSASALGRYDEARTALEMSIGLGRSLDDRWGLGFAYRGLGAIAQAQGEHREAVARFRESLATLRPLGARQDVARVLAELGRSVLALGNVAEYSNPRSAYAGCSTV